MSARAYSQHLSRDRAAKTNTTLTLRPQQMQSQLPVIPSTTIHKEGRILHAQVSDDTPTGLCEMTRAAAAAHARTTRLRTPYQPTLQLCGKADHA